jgi:hypothetical protein
MMDALTNERIIIASNELDLIPDYGKAVSACDRIGVIDYDIKPVSPEINYQGQAYRLSGATRRCQGYECTPYEKVKRVL